MKLGANTMANIDTAAATAFRNGTNYHNSNTEVHTDPDTGESRLRLWGNLIAWTTGNRKRLNICQRGWDTRTTNSRLRALGVAIEHKRGKLYINGQPASDTDTITMEL